MHSKVVSLVLVASLSPFDAWGQTESSASDSASAVDEAKPTATSVPEELAPDRGTQPESNEARDEAVANESSPERATPQVEPPTEATSSPPSSEDPFLASPPKSDESRSERSASDGVGFLQNRIRLGMRLGWASTTEQTWGLVGAGVGYYVFDGLEALVDGDIWIGSPTIFVLTPGLRYVFHWLSDVKPYVGPLYRHYFRTDGGLETDAIGGRVGVYFMLSRTAYVGGGLFYEHRLDENLFAKRDAVFPEISLSFSF